MKRGRLSSGMLGGDEPLNEAEYDEDPLVGSGYGVVNLH